MKRNILVVEDESLVALDISNALKKAGYAVCAIVDNGQDAINEVANHNPDLVLMDIYIEGTIDGIETAKRIKALHQTPIVYLTAFGDKSTIAEAVRSSPEGYLLKPFKRQELYAALELALFKAAKDNDERSTKEFLCNDYFYDKQARSIIYKNEPISLTKKEMQLLELLVCNKGRIVPFETIDLELWPEKSVTETTRRTLTHRLRGKLGTDCLKTIPGVGCKIG